MTTKIPASMTTGLATTAQLDARAPAIVADRMLVDNTAGTARETKTFDQVKTLWDPNSELLRGDGYKLTYHKARGAWHVRAFGTSLTDVGAGNAAVDTPALQSAMSSGEAIDVTGVNLEINDTIDVVNVSAKVGASNESRQPGGKSSIINIADNELPDVFNVTGQNFEANSFSVRGRNDNELTTIFRFERPAGGARDIDARLINVGMSIAGRGVYHKGRGLEASGCLYSDLHIACNEVDQPATWIPTGSGSIDGIDTGTRAYRFNNSRAHAIQCPFILNTGAYAVNIGGIEVNGLIADVGAAGGLFKGVFIDLMATGIQCRFPGQPASRMIALDPGSRSCVFSNFNAVGYIGASGNRLPTHALQMEASAALPIKDIMFVGGMIGPTLSAGVNMFGNGAFDNIIFNSVTWDRIGQDGGVRSPIQIAATVPSTVIKLIGTHARDNFTSRPFLTALNTPENNTMYREVTSTIDASFSAWATAGVVQPT